MRLPLDLSNELMLTQIAHRAQETGSIALNEGEIEAQDSFNPRGDRPNGQQEIPLEEVRSIIERINEKYGSEFTDFEARELQQATQVMTEADGFVQLAQDNPEDLVVDTEWKRFFMGAIPKIEDQTNAFWTAIREDQDMAKDFGQFLVRAAYRAANDTPDDE